QDGAERAALIGGAAGATVIEPRLKEILPPGLPVEVLEPGVELERFAAPLAPHRRASILKALGAAPDAAVMVYPGNVHRANLAEMTELYLAVARLREDGRNVVLIRTGKDDVDLPGGPGLIKAG